MPSLKELLSCAPALFFLANLWRHHRIQVNFFLGRTHHPLHLVGGNFSLKKWEIIFCNGHFEWKKSTVQCLANDWLNGWSRDSSCGCYTHRLGHVTWLPRNSISFKVINAISGSSLLEHVEIFAADDWAAAVCFVSADKRPCQVSVNTCNYWPADHLPVGIRPENNCGSPEAS